MSWPPDPVWTVPHMAWYGQTVWLEHWERSWGDALLFCVAIYSPVQRNLVSQSVRCGELFQEHWCNHREAGCPSDHFGKASAPRLNDIVSVAWPDGQLGYSLIQHTHKHCQQQRYGPHTHAHWEGQPRCWNWFSSHHSADIRSSQPTRIILCLAWALEWQGAAVVRGVTEGARVCPQSPWAGKDGPGLVIHLDAGPGILSLCL